MGGGKQGELVTNNQIVIFVNNEHLWTTDWQSLNTHGLVMIGYKTYLWTDRILK